MSETRGDTCSYVMLEKIFYLLTIVIIYHDILFDFSLDKMTNTESSFCRTCLASNDAEEGPRRAQKYSWSLQIMLDRSHSKPRQGRGQGQFRLYRIFGNLIVTYMREVFSKFSKTSIFMCSIYIFLLTSIDRFVQFIIL